MWVGAAGGVTPWGLPAAPTSRKGSVDSLLLHNGCSSGISRFIGKLLQVQEKISYTLDRLIVCLILCSALGPPVSMVSVVAFSKPGGTGLTPRVVVAVDASPWPETHARARDFTFILAGRPLCLPTRVSRILDAPRRAGTFTHWGREAVVARRAALAAIVSPSSSLSSSSSPLSGLPM